jgi:hypothetical protein
VTRALAQEADFAALPVESFARYRFPSEGEVKDRITWQEFHTVRNALLDRCRAFGTVGPMGTAPIVDGADDGPPDPWPVEAENPQIFVVDDLWNDVERHHRVELADVRVFTREFLMALWSLVRDEYPRWGIGLSIPDGYLYLMADRLLVKGSRFRRARTAEQVVAAGGSAE